MKKLIASALVVALAITAVPVDLSAAGRARQTGQIAGAAMVDGRPMGNVIVRLRNLDTGQLVGNMNANAQGGFSFSGLGPGNFVVETVAPNGTMLGTSAAITLTPAAMTATGITVSASATALGASGALVGAISGVSGTRTLPGQGGAAGGVAGGTQAAAAGGGLAAVGGTLGAVAIAAAVIGVTTAIVIAKKDTSPSQ
jgi:hypothetical protein